MHRHFILNAITLLLAVTAQTVGQQPADSQPKLSAPAGEPGYLGLITSDRQPRGGVRVMRVDRGSPAEAAGIKEGDLLVAIGDRPIVIAQDMRDAMRDVRPGVKLTIKVNRGGTATEHEVTPGERPAKTEQNLQFGPIPEDLPPPPVVGRSPTTVPPPAEPPAQPPIERDPALEGTAKRPPPSVDPDAPPHATAYLGVRTVPVTERDRWMLELPLRMGAKVAAVSVGSPADRAGLPLYAVIVGVNGKAVTSPSDLARRIATFEPGEEVELSYYYRGEATRRRVVLGAAEAPGLVESRPAPEAFEPPAVAANQQRRIDELEREVAQLKQRLAKLEEALQKPPDITKPADTKPADTKPPSKPE
jgi:predicted metalloprotease with PDZ domain